VAEAEEAVEEVTAEAEAEVEVAAEEVAADDEAEKDGS